MTSRENAFGLARKRACENFRTLHTEHCAEFGKHVFSKKVMEKMLPEDVYKNILSVIEGKRQLKIEYADVIAVAMKEWAISLGATHFTHWFFPLSGAAAEKHDSFLDKSGPDGVIQRFGGKQLIQGEPDASSFPSGGLRSTFEARGYTGWDPSTPPFVWKSGGGVVLCVPTIFYSWTGDALDVKIPLLRSDSKLNKAVLRLLHLLKIDASFVYSTLGIEQEYFVIDDALYSLRPDLMILGKTVYGASPPKGQELEDHYFTSVKDRLLSYMEHVENAALELGIPLKTRHNEVAPAQHEMAPVFDRASVSCDHNVLLMELLHQIAKSHGLATLLSEKPFQKINGSGKHNNWSLMTDKGLNLLDPENSLQFLILLTAILHAVYSHADLLRASIASYGNDFRLGGDEAPPVIISVYLGEALEKVLDSIEMNKSLPKVQKGKKDLNIPTMPKLPCQSSDRNRTSPFAFTGNKFEFRAVGSSENCSWPITVINVIVTDSLNLILDDIEKEMAKEKQSIEQVCMPIIRKYLKISRPIRFMGDNYSKEWEIEAKKRKLSNEKCSVEALKTLKSQEILKLFKGVLKKKELHSRYEIFLEKYAKQVNIQANLMLEMFYTQILPASMRYQKMIAKTLSTLAGVGKFKTENQLKLLEKLTFNINEAITLAEKVKKSQEKASLLGYEKSAQSFSSYVLPECQKLREVVDCLEALVDDHLWPFPKYRELLFSV